MCVCVCVCVRMCVCVCVCARACVHGTVTPKKNNELTGAIAVKILDLQISLTIDRNNYFSFAHCQP